MPQLVIQLIIADISPLNMYTHFDIESSAPTSLGMSRRHKDADAWLGSCHLSPPPLSAYSTLAFK